MMLVGTLALPLPSFHSPIKSCSLAIQLSQYVKEQISDLGIDRTSEDIICRFYVGSMQLFFPVQPS